MIGQTVAHYRIIEKLGAGGMGEVYKARDTRLNRFVALKVLPAQRLADQSRKQRFIQEAQAASALDHPNIITVYELVANTERDCLVMEYVPGKTLDALIPRAGMRLGALLKMAIQVAEGLSAAHAAGIVHRDVKPSNIMLSESGLVKILDFGLAKLVEHAEGNADEPTRTLVANTDPGTVVGTAAYMSPEQAEGRPLDARSDIFSFGAVLYEMAAGRRAFSGDSQAATLAAVLNTEPKPLREAAPDVPLELERIVMRCLRKDPAKRQQHMTDVKVLLEELKEESESGKRVPAGTSQATHRRWSWMAAAAALLLAGVGIGLWLTRGREELPPRVVPLTAFAGNETQPSFSPDGNQVVFAWNGEKQNNWDIYVKMIGSATVLRLTTDATDDLFPAWSPDGRQIAFLKGGERTGLYLISPLGGPERKIAEFDAAPGAPAWSPDGKFLVAAKYRQDQDPAPDAGELFLVPVETGEPRPFLVPAPGRWYRYPAFSPDGRSLAVDSCGGSTQAPFCDVVLVDLTADFLPRGKPRQLTAAGVYSVGMAWSADGRSLVYSAGTTPQYFLLFRLDLAGDGQPKRLEMASQGATYPAVARKNNRLAFSRWAIDTDVWRLQVGNKPEPLLVSSAADRNAQFSPDGQRVAFASGRSAQSITIWLANADGGGLVQLTRGPEEHHGSPRWSPDGRWIAFDARGKDGRWNIGVVESSGGPSRRLTSGPFSNNVPAWSHDGNWIYFSSDRTGRFEIWRVPSQGGLAEQITRDGGYAVLESPDASTLYYTKGGGTGPLFCRPLRGGEETQVIKRVAMRGFAVFEDGIYYLDSIGPAKSEICFHEFATRRNRVIGSIDAPLSYGLSVSPDRKTFLFTRYASAGSDLMLIENFR